MNIEEAIKVLELLNTVTCAMEMFCKGNVQIKVEELREAISAIKRKCTELVSIERGEAYKKPFFLLDKLLKENMPNTSRINNLFQQYSNGVGNAMIQEIVDWLQSGQALSKENALALVGALEDGSYPAQNKALVKMLVARLITFSLPEVSFRLTIEAFQEYPELGKQFGESRKDYVYRPLKEQFFDACPICGCEDVKPYYNAQTFFTVNFDATVSPAKLWCQCMGCHNYFSYNMSEEMYEEAGMPLHAGDAVNEIGQIIRRPNGTLGYFSSVINRIRTFNQGRRYLEIGVDTGEFVAVAKEMGLEIEAIEISQSVCNQLKNVIDFEAICIDFMKYETTRTYDVISMGDVIEHVDNPRQALEQAHHLLNDQGILWISTPNYNSAFSQMMKFSDPMWREISHRVYFCRETFERLLEEEGFAILEYQVSGRYNGSMEIIAQRK